MVTGQKLAANPTAIETRAIDVVVLFHGNPRFVGPFFEWFHQQSVRAEMAKLDCSLTAIDISPGHGELKSALQAATERFRRDISFQLLRDEANLGFLHCVNSALNAAIEKGLDVILLDSNTFVYPDIFSELQAVSRLDPMIGFVSPRSNKATICSLPHQEQFQRTSPCEASTVFQQLSRYLPPACALPTCSQFFLPNAIGRMEFSARLLDSSTSA